MSNTHNLEQPYLDARLANGGECKGDNIYYHGTAYINGVVKQIAIGIKNPGIELPLADTLMALLELFEEKQYTISWIAINWDAYYLSDEWDAEFDLMPEQRCLLDK